jgi:hypothetical protein
VATLLEGSLTTAPAAVQPGPADTGTDLEGPPAVRARRRASIGSASVLSHPIHRIVTVTVWW